MHARGEEYQARFDRLAESGADIHGEADLVTFLGARRVLDAGCGTGRVAIELARRGMSVTGVDRDADMLAVARGRAPELEWRRADLATDALPGGFDAVVMAGNVMIFVVAGTEAAVVARVGGTLVDGGLLVAGFQLGRRPWTLDDYDGWCAAAGLAPVQRWATWDRRPWRAGDDYAVSVHRRTAPSTRGPGPAVNL